MTMPVIDLIVLALLVGTLAYAALVDRRVRALMAALEELRPAVAALSEATDRAQGSVAALRSAADGIASGEGTAKEAASEPDRPAAIPPEDDKSDLITRFFENARGRSA